MAGDAVVEVTDDTVVEVDIDPTLIGEDDAAHGTTGKTNGAAAAAQDAVAEAAASLTKAKADAEERARAAEATAASERGARLAAEQRAGGAENEAARLRETAENQELQIITSGIETATREVATEQAAFEVAMEAGDFKKAGTAQANMAKAASALDRFETQKVQYENGARRTPAATTEGRVVAPHVDPQEQYLAQFRPEAQTWLRSHRECLPATVGGSTVKNAQMMKGHYAALAQGLPEGTPDYFRVIEEEAGYRSPVSAAAATTEVTPTPKTPARPRPTPAAPVSRDPPEGSAVTGHTNPKTVRLTPQQQEVALFSYPAVRGEADTAHRKRAFGTYANELVKATADGTIGRLTH
jgi:hypothetical protein